MFVDDDYVMMNLWLMVVNDKSVADVITSMINLWLMS